jgi:hypothetical protein
MASESAHLFTPREAIRTGGRGGRGGGISYPMSGAQIDYYVAGASSSELKLEVLDAAGKVVRTFTSSTGTGAEEGAADAAPADDEEGSFRFRGGPTRLDKNPGMHRFTWDLRYPGPWQSAARPESPNGPTAVPGKYSVRLTLGSWTATQPFVLAEDPRNAADGVTLSDLREQFEHNLRVRDLVSQVNQTVARVRSEQSKASGDKEIKLKELSTHLVTPAIRYSKPELQTQITYLYSVTTATDQKIGRDVIDRYTVLKKELDQRIGELGQILK